MSQGGLFDWKFAERKTVYFNELNNMSTCLYAAVGVQLYADLLMWPTLTYLNSY